MKTSTLAIINSLKQRYAALSSCAYDITQSIINIADCFRCGGKLLLCGNGGSASDCEHIVGELMKSFMLKRPMPDNMGGTINAMFPEDAEYLTSKLQLALPALSLVSQTSLLTAFSNDVAPDLVFAQQVLGYARRGDVLMAISTSGNSRNIILAAETAKAMQIKVISLTGNTGGKLRVLSDTIICVPASETFKIQEYHLPIYHCICSCLENEFFGTED